MRRFYLRLEDKSSTGGVVIEGISSCTHQGKALTYIGAKVACSACGAAGTISPMGPRWPDDMMGKQIALEGDICLCKCHPLPIMYASQNSMYQSFEAEELAEKGFSSDGRLVETEPLGSYDERVRVVDSAGHPLCGVPFYIKTKQGVVHKGLTNVGGYCPRIHTRNIESLEIAIGHQALERWDQ